MRINRLKIGQRLGIGFLKVVVGSVEKADLGTSPSLHHRLMQ